MISPIVRETAFQIIADCAARDDACEIKAIFDAVKHGTPNVEGLERGVRYVLDPRWTDHFTGPAALLQMCKRGACQEDCDGHAALLCALLGSIGFKVGLRAWGPKGQEFEHVYAVVGYPKKGPNQVLGLDTTVPSSRVGWEPPPGNILTAWAE